jgi:tartrate dehydratase alpha subunit/fumarate hydratase class I-like protein
MCHLRLPVNNRVEQSAYQALQRLGIRVKPDFCSRVSVAATHLGVVAFSLASCPVVGKIKCASRRSARTVHEGNAPGHFIFFE